MVRLSFDALGHQTRVALTTTDAIILVHSHPFDLVILDLNIPGLPVDQFVAATKTRIPGCRIVLASGSGDLNERSAELKTDGCIRKPYSVDELIPMLPTP